MLLKNFKKIGLKILPIALVAALVGAYISLPAESAQAVIGPNPYVDITATKVFDGTGQGTPSQTFVNSDNGFTPGDNTPTDGIVSSHDTVEYSVSMTFKSGLARTISVNMEGTQYLDWIVDKATFCANSSGITAVINGNNCEFTIVQGATAHITRQMFMTALDSEGTVKDDQFLTINYGVKNQESFASIRTESVSVVSAPLVDMFVTPENTRSWNSAGTGQFTLEPLALYPLNYASNKGQSTMTPWTAVADVANFPEGTTWTNNGVAVPMVNGQLELLGQGSSNIVFIMPNNVWPEQEEGTTANYDIGLTIPTTAFQSEDYLNNGDGWQPGTDMTRNQSTFDAQRGSKPGIFFRNNDYTAARVVRPANSDGVIYRKAVQVPYTPNASLMESSNMTFADATTTQNSTSNTIRSRYIGSEFNAIISFNSNGVNELGQLVLGDHWDSSQAIIRGPVTITDANNAVIDASNYTVQWSTIAPNNSSLSDRSVTEGWVSTNNPIPNANGVRVIFNENYIAPNSGVYSVTVPMQIRANLPENASALVFDRLYGSYYTAGGVTNGNVPGQVIALWPEPATLNVEQTVDKDFFRVKDELTYTVSSSITRPVSLENGVQAKYTVTLDRCAVNPTLPTGSLWAMEIIPGINGSNGSICGSDDSTPMQLVFTPINGSINPATVSIIDGDQAAIMPNITYTVTASLKTRDPINSSVIFEVLNQGDEILPVSDDSTSLILSESNSFANIVALQDKVEITKPVSWSIDLIQSFTAGDSQTVIAFPHNDDGVYWPLIDDPDDQYPGVHESSFNGSYTLTSAAYDVDQTSENAELWFTVQSSPSFDPTVGVWHKVAEAGIDGNPALAGATALKSVATNNGEAIEYAAKINVTLQPVDNRTDDVYIMWVGPTDIQRIAAPAPWPAQSEVVSSSINGTIWWDEDNSATIEADEPRISGVQVGLFEVINGAPAIDPLDVTTTDDDGYYEFEVLLSGNYITRILDRGSNLPDSELSYYNDEIDVANTYSFNGQRYTRASDSSTNIDLGIDAVKDDVNYGFFQADPKVDVDKTAQSSNCFNGVCEITWTVDITNFGNTDITMGTFTDTVSNNVYDVEAQFGEFIPGEIVVDVAYRNNNGAYALTESGLVYSWGLGSFGSNGNDSTDNNLTAQLVQGLPNNVSKIVARSSTGGYALTSDGQVYSWGQGANGANGNGSENDNHTAELVQDLPNNIIEIVQRSNYGGYAITSNGQVYSWGYGLNGANGNDSSDDNFTAQLVQDLPNTVIKVVERSINGGYALTSTGEVYSWGQGGAGANGNGSNANNFTAQLVQNSPNNVIEVIARNNIGGYALTSTGEVYSWGYGNAGANGNGSNANNFTAQLVQGLSNDVIEVIARSAVGGYALTSNGLVYSWGQGIAGANGNNSTADNLIAQLVQDLPNSVSKVVARSSSGGYALASNSQVYSWGGGTSGANGNGSNTENFTAQLVQGITSNVIDVVSRGSNGGYALTSNGQVYSWGLGSQGANGNGSGVSNLTAQLVQGLPNNVSKINSRTSGAGYALTSNGQVYSWGYGVNGANGNGSESHNLIAGLVQGIPATEVLPSSAVPPTSVAPNGSFTDRTYSIPFLPVGETTTVIYTGKVNQGDADFNVLNQAWFTSPSTPIAGILPDGLTRPELPIDPGANPNIDGIPGNPTCNTDADPGGQTVADSCDQVPVPIPASDVELGSLSGNVWVDANGSGVKQPGGLNVAGITATLRLDGVIRGEAITDEFGNYSFFNLLPSDGYTVTFDINGFPPSEEIITGLGLDPAEAWSYGYTIDAVNCNVDLSCADPTTQATRPAEVIAGADTAYQNAGVVLANAGISVIKTSAAGDPASLTADAHGNSEAVEVQLSFTNEGTEPLTDFTWTDETLAGPDLVNLVCSILPTDVLQPGDTVTCTAILPVMNVSDPEHEDVFTVTAVGTLTGTPVSGNDNWQAVVEGEASWTLSKTSNPVSGSFVGVNEEITYTVTATNTGDLNLDNLEIFDDMSQVLNNAELVSDLPAGVQQSGTSFIWIIDELAPGDSVSISYTVKVNEDAWGVTLVNGVTGNGVVPPADCAPDSPCETDHSTPPWPGAFDLPVLGNIGLIALIVVGLGTLIAAIILVGRRRITTNV